MPRKWSGVGGDLHTCWMLRKMLGWGWGDDNVPCTCTHVECYSTGLGRGGWSRSLNLHTCWMPCKWSIHNKPKATRLINDQIWEYLYSWQWRQNVGKDLWTNTQEVFAEWKKAPGVTLQIQARPWRGRHLVFPGVVNLSSAYPEHISHPYRHFWVDDSSFPYVAGCLSLFSGECA